ncbi:MAG: hypothetical protein H6822_06490 [Planctomycetaceae bacterium]|nr:hypothetical protein [Planctomycetaceae bacterium]
MIRAVAPNWHIKIYEPDAAEQKGQIIQIMDYDVSRNFIAKQVASHRKTNPCWLAQVIDQILKKYDKTPIITFKKAIRDPSPEFDLVKLLKSRDRVGGLFNFPCRGHTFSDKSLIVLGTPYKDEATIWELASAIYGFEGLPKSKYERRDRVEECFVAGNMGYEDQHLRSIQEFLVSAEISQAIGRLRPLQNDCVVYVITNCEIKDWTFQQFTASELFEMRRSLRRDCADAYERYSQVACRKLQDCGSTSNAEICKELNFNMRRGREHLARFKNYHKQKIDCKGHTVRLKDGATIKG